MAETSNINSEGKITELTEEQNAYLIKYRDQQFEIACGGGRIDRVVLHDGICKAYETIGENPPELVVCSSPFEALIVLWIMNVIDRHIEELETIDSNGLKNITKINADANHIFDKLHTVIEEGWIEKTNTDQSETAMKRLNQKYTYISNMCKQALLDATTKATDDENALAIFTFFKQRWQTLKDIFENKFKCNDDEQLLALICEHMESSITANAAFDTPTYNPNYLIGSQSLFWISFYKFAEYIGVKYDSDSQHKLNVINQISTQCEWWWPFEGICIASQRPLKTHWEDDMLHNPNGKAVEYEDGFGWSSWRGTQVPDEWLDGSDTLTPQIALTRGNVEQRRSACEILGWAKVLEDPSLNPLIINEDEPHIGTLIQVDLPDAPGQWFLKYTCGTGRIFCEPVTDKNFNTALKANAGGNGWRPGRGDPDDYIPFMRT